MKKRERGAVVVTLPPVPERCERCGRPLHGSVNSPYGPWAVPVTDGRTGVTVCTMCHDGVIRSSERRLRLPAASRKLLNRYIGQAYHFTGLVYEGKWRGVRVRGVIRLRGRTVGRFRRSETGLYTTELDGLGDDEAQRLLEEAEERLLRK